MPGDMSWNARRVAVLRTLLARWIAELPAIAADDADRVLAQEQGIADLRLLIASIEAERMPTAITAAT